MTQATGTNVSSIEDEDYNIYELMGRDPVALDKAEVAAIVDRIRQQRHVYEASKKNGTPTRAKPRKKPKLKDLPASVQDSLFGDISPDSLLGGAGQGES